LTLWRQLYGEATVRLGHAQAARWFVEDASGGTWPAVLDERVPEAAARMFFSLVERREAGEPVQYVLGHWSFRRLDLMVDRRVLIPRPETEVVVEVALAELGELGARAPVVVDLGTGSGAIALSILAEHPTAHVWATDISPDALDVASANLSGLGVSVAGRGRLVRGDWWSALPESLMGTVDLVVTNPPYVAGDDRDALPAEVCQWEPMGALVPGPTGLEALHAVVVGAAKWLAPRSALVAEIAPDQAGPVTAMAMAAGFAHAAVRPDLAGRDRALVARRQQH
jgi:release factor glutamine methyltransferase